MFVSIKYLIDLSIKDLVEQSWVIDNEHMFMCSCKKLLDGICELIAIFSSGVSFLFFFLDFGGFNISERLTLLKPL